MDTTQRTVMVAAGATALGLLAGAVRSRPAAAAARTDYVRTGLFTVPANHSVAFHATLDDRAGAPRARVTLRVFDAAGQVMAQDVVSLGAGQSHTLRFAQAGLFRAHAEIVHPGGAFSARRTVLGGIEVIDAFGTTIRPICSFDRTGVGAGRD